MGYNMLVTILFLTTVFFFHLNLSSNDPINLELLDHQNDASNQPTSEVSLQMQTFSQQTNYPIFEISNRCIYPTEIIFREYIVPTLNSEKICNLYKFFQSKNPSIPHENFLPSKRFFKSHPLLSLPEFEQKKIFYTFNDTLGQSNQVSEFKPIIFNPITKTLKTIPTDIERYQNIPDGGVVFFSKEKFFFCSPELNTKPLGDENKTVMIVTDDDDDEFFLILEDSTDKNSKQYSVICHGKYAEKREKSVLLYKTWKVQFERENVEYPKDISFILKAKYMSGIQKYYFKFQYGHIKICQKGFKSWFRFLRKVGEFSDWAFDHYDDSCVRLMTLFLFFYLIFPIDMVKRLIEFASAMHYRNPTKLQKALKLFANVIIDIFSAYVWMAPYKIIMGALLSPLYFYYSPLVFFLTFNLEPFIAAIFWGPTWTYVALQFSWANFKIYPLEKMSAIPTCKTPYKYIFQAFLYAWFVMIILTSFVYGFLPAQKMSGEFLE